MVYVSIREAAKRLGRDERTVRRWAAQHRLAASVGMNGRMIIDEAEIERLQGELAKLATDENQAHQGSALERLIAEVGSMASQIAALNERVGYLEEEIRAGPYQRQSSPARILREPRAQPQQERVTQESEALAALSGDVVASPLFATQHFPHEAPKKITRLLQTLRENGKVPMKLGHYKNGKGTSPYGLDAEGRRAFYLATSGREGFERCNECPH